MATQQAPVNGNYASQSTSIPPSTSPAPSTGAQQPEVSKDEIAWYFVERYYNTLSRSPEKLYLFFSKRSQLVSGVEEEKVEVCAGQSAIQARIAELDYHECKVRVSNVDSQTSLNNIVIQVIGEMSNKSGPSRKFVHTFVLAPQTNGYYVLNDIFRFIKEDEEEDIETESAPVETASQAPGHHDPAPTAQAVDIEEPAALKETAVEEEDAKKVDEKLEEVIEEANHVDTPETNGSAESVTEDAEDKQLAVQDEVVPEPKVAEEPVKETPPAAVQEPKESSKPAASPAPPAPALPKTWAQLAGGGKTALAPPSSASASAAPSAAPSKPTLAPSSTPAASAVAGSSPARQPSPAGSAQESSSGGWQTAGADHSRKQSRAQAGPVVAENGRVRAYVKNVYPHVDADELKSTLSKFGELPYFDISRPKNSAFVEFATVAAFNAAVAANPHKVGNENIYVEERRPAGGFGQRGSIRGRGGSNFEARPGQSRGGFTGNKDNTPRGASTGFPRGGGGGANRGGAGNTGRGRPQAV